MKTHGHTTKTTMSPTYRSWHMMHVRCRSEPRYLTRGTSICPEWSAFENFLADMGERPAGTTLDRIDNAGHYEPVNCRWATRKVQQRNRSTNNLITLDGETKCLQEWADALGLKPHTLYYRMTKLGWDLRRALTEPPQNRGRRLTNQPTKL